MGDHRSLKIECLHRVGDPESKQLKVAALNLFRPTAVPLFRKAVFSYYDTVSWGRKEDRVIFYEIRKHPNSERGHLGCSEFAIGIDLGFGVWNLAFLFSFTSYPLGVIIYLPFRKVFELPTMTVAPISIPLTVSRSFRETRMTSSSALLAFRTIPTGVRSDRYFDRICQAISRGLVLFLLFGL